MMDRMKWKYLQKSEVEKTAPHKYLLLELLRIWVFSR
jgi:hypothetical protein